eukprot:COSAG06_NODE_6563_length_2879_cov_28.712950_4_plen_229_part_01
MPMLHPAFDTSKGGIAADDFHSRPVGGPGTPLQSVNGATEPPREKGRNKTQASWEKHGGWSVTLTLAHGKEFEGVEAPQNGLSLRYCFGNTKWLRSGKKNWTKEAPCPWCSKTENTACKCDIIGDAKAAAQYQSTNDFALVYTRMQNAQLTAMLVALLNHHKISVPPTFSRGGEVIGPGSGTSDDIVARLSDGEYILSEHTSRRAGRTRTRRPRLHYQSAVAPGRPSSA